MRKNVILCLILLLCLASISSAQMLVGARASGMGGAGVATSFDLSSAYYNPACIMKAGNFGFQGSLAAAYQGLDKLASAANAASDPAKFLSDNYSSDVNVNGSIRGLAGVNINKVGITVIPNLGLNLSKPKDSLDASGMAGVNYPVYLTMGKTYALLAGLPDVSFGANIKYLGGTSGSVRSSTNVSTGYTTAYQQTGNVSGFGLDLGTLMTFNVPFVTTMNVGFVARDLAETLTNKNESVTMQASPGSQTFTEVSGSRISTSTSTTADPSYVLGASVTIPVIGMLVATDLESGKNFSNTHIGIEYPLILGVLALRAGTASGDTQSLTTFGVKVGLPVFSLNAAAINDNRVANNNSYVVDFGAAL